MRKELRAPAEDGLEACIAVAVDGEEATRINSLAVLPLENLPMDP